MHFKRYIKLKAYTHKNILYQTKKLYDDKKEEIMI